MGYLADTLAAQDTNVSAPSNDTLGDALRKGWSSGVDSLGANVNQIAGLGAEAMGASDFAQGRYRAAQGLREDAGRNAPMINSLDQVDGVGNALRWGAGQLGASAPYVAGVVGGTVATGNPLVGGALALGLPEAGDIAYRQTLDPEAMQAGAGERLLRAGAGGAASGVVQSLGPGMLINKAMKGAGTELAKRSVGNIVGKNMLEGVGVNAAAEGTSEALKQFVTNTDKPLDTDAITENALAGAVMGVPFGAAGAGVDLVKSAPTKTWIGAKNAAQGGLESARGALEGTKDTLTSAWESAKPQIDAGLNGVKGAWDSMPEGVRGVGEFIKDKVEDQVASARTAYQNIMADDSVPAALKEQAKSWGSNLASTANRAYLWSADQMRGAKTTVKDAEPVDVIGKLRDFSKPATDMVDTILNSESMESTKAFAGKTLDQAKAMLKERGGQFTEYLGPKVDDLLKRADVSDERKQQLAGLRDNLSDSASQVKAATILKAQQAADAVKPKVEAAYTEVEAAYKKMFPDNPDVKKSDDHSGMNALIFDRIGPMITEAKPELLEDPATTQKLGSTLRMFMKAAAEGKDLRVAGIHTAMTDLLGPDLAHDVLNAAHEFATGGDQTKQANYFKHLTDSVKDKNDMDGLETVITKNLSTEAPQRTGVTDNPRELAKFLRSWARGETSAGKPRERVEFEDQQVQKFLEQHFGTNSKKVLDALQKDVEAERGKQRANPGAEDDVEFGTTEEYDTSVAYHGADNIGDRPKLYESDAAVKSRGGAGEYGSAVAQAIKKLKAENPDMNVSFVKLTDYAKSHNLMPEQIAEMADGKDPSQVGFIKKERIKNDDGLEEYQVRGMRGKIKSAKHPDAITVEGRSENYAYDSRRIANVMHKAAKDDWSDVENANGMHGRMAQKFAEGIAKLTVHEGRKLNVRDDHVIATVDGKDFTWGEAQKVLKNPDTIKTPEHLKNASAAEIKLHESLPDLSDADLTRLTKKAVKARDDIFEPIKELIVKDTRDEMGFAAAGSNRAEAINKEIMKRIEAAAKDESTGVPRYNRLVQAMESEQARRSGEGKEKDAERNTLGLRAEPANSNPVTLKAALIRRSDSPMKDAIANRLEALAKNMQMMSAKDQAELIRAASLNSIVDLKEAIDPLARKYKDAIVPPKGETRGDQGLGDKSGTLSKTVQTAEERATAERRKQAEDAFLNDLFVPPPAEYQKTPMERTAGVPPDPKSVAAKKAALLEKAASGDEALTEELSKSDDAKGLQRAAEALADGAPESDAMTAVNERLGELVQDPSTAYGLQTKKHSLDATAATNTSPLTAKGRKQILDYLNRATPWVQAEFPFLEHAGEFTKEFGQAIIRVSTHALNPTSVAYHESLHAFFQHLKDNSNADVSRVIMDAASSPAVTTQLRKLLSHSPEAQAQLSNAEERAAYMYQFWADGKLQLGEKPTTLFGKITEALRKVLGIWSNDERALHIMEYFHSGEYAQSASKPSAVRAALMEKGRNAALDQARGMGGKFMEMGDALWGAGSARLRDSQSEALHELADLIKMRGTDAGEDRGYLPAARLKRTEFVTQLAEGLAGMDESVMHETLEALQNGKKPTSPEALKAHTVIRKLLDDVFDYLHQSGVNVKDLGYGKDYFPRHWDSNYLSKHEAEFMDMARKYPEWNDPQDTFNKLIANDGSELRVVDRPGMQANKKRVLSFISDADAAPFMSKNLPEIMNGYITQATRRGEWARRFSDDSSKIKELLIRAKAEGATRAEIEHAQDFVAGVNGTLGDDLNPTLRRYMGNMVVYQNIRLLPLAIFSSVVDPMGVMVRGGSVSNAWNTFKRGVREVPAGLKGEQIKDYWTDMAQTLGVIDDASLQRALGSLYTQGMVGGTARKVNDAFFRYNLMEQFNQSVRVGATEAAMGFIAKHADGKASVHSPRWMAELGLRPGDVKMVNGRPAISEAEGLTAAQAARMKRAVNQWVDGAVLRPDAADKPTWMNDPKFMLISHLKQFVYAFHHTILDRVIHEAKHQNYAPVMALSSYVPVMIAADMLKGLIQGGGEEPDWKKAWGPADYLENGVERAGLFGVGQFGVDALKGNFGSLSGPTLGQFADAYDVLGGTRQFGSFAIHSLPANQLYAGALNAATEDPNFTE